jgi:hypothetical protein
VCAAHRVCALVSPAPSATSPSAAAETGPWVPIWSNLRASELRFFLEIIVFWVSSEMLRPTAGRDSDAKPFAQSTETPCLSCGDSSRTPPSNAPAHVVPFRTRLHCRSRFVVGKVVMQHAAARRVYNGHRCAAPIVCRENIGRTTQRWHLEPGTAPTRALSAPLACARGRLDRSRTVQGIPLKSLFGAGLQVKSGNRHQRLILAQAKRAEEDRAPAPPRAGIGCAG